MKFIKIAVIVILLFATLACQHYGGVAIDKKGRAVVLVNDNFLFGFLRKAKVCKVTASGLANCQENESP